MRLSEVYTSVQGEGPDAGVLTQFVRFAGCNLRCPGWPCDTQHAIDPEKYRHEWEKVSPDAVAARVGWGDNIRHITLTGGEPFLQPAKELEHLVQQYLSHCQFNVFTNGTLDFPLWIQSPRVKVIMDWKLPGSGEVYSGMRGDNPARLTNIAKLGSEDAVKFVCTGWEDFCTAHRVVENHPELFRKDRGNPTLYIGAAWGRLTEAQLVEWLKLHGNPHNFKLNVQVHNYIYDREERGI